MYKCMPEDEDEDDEDSFEDDQENQIIEMKEYSKGSGSLALRKTTGAQDETPSGKRAN